MLARLARCGRGATGAVQQCNALWLAAPDAKRCRSMADARWGSEDGCQETSQRLGANQRVRRARAAAHAFRRPSGRGHFAGRLPAGAAAPAEGLRRPLRRRSQSAAGRTAHNRAARTVPLTFPRAPEVSIGCGVPRRRLSGRHPGARAILRPPRASRLGHGVRGGALDVQGQVRRLPARPLQRSGALAAAPPQHARCAASSPRPARAPPQGPVPAAARAR